MADKLANAIVDYGYNLSTQTKSNQIFAILPSLVIGYPKVEFDFYEWQALDNDNFVVRLVTSWATHEHQVDKFIALLGSFDA